MASSTATKQKTTEAKTQAAETTKTIIPKEIDINQYIPVRNGFQGTLIYESRRTGEIFKWDRYGDEQEMSLLELRNAKGSGKDFFINNWFMFDEEWNWVIDYLGMKKFYSNSIPIDKFDDIFNLDSADLEKKLNKLSKGQMKSVAYRASELIGEGKIDSMKTISVLEKCLGVELIEK